jgi:membrane-bound lytic murein transglycosylase A
VGLLLILGILAACTTPPAPKDPLPEPTRPAPPIIQAPAITPLPPSVALDEVRPEPVVTPQHPAWQWADSQPLPAPITRGVSVWHPVRWSELPGWGRDALNETWNAWLRSCERPAPVIGVLCTEVRQLSIAPVEDQHDWMMRRLQPFRVQAPNGQTPGLLTGYFEPEMLARRVRDDVHQTPLHGLPVTLRPGQPWFTRQQMATDPAAQAQLQGREIAWMADPLDALMLQIQGSGRMTITEPDGQQRMVRLAFAGHNSHPYRSVGRWLLDRGWIRQGTWEAIRTWAAANPERVNDMLWSNPRTVFFREEPLSELDAQFGPRGAQGVPLTPRRSIAVDPRSIPYGTPVWMHSPGPYVHVRRLVLAQDTGGAIIGPIRADFFTGWGQEAYVMASGISQPLQMWALWPRP